MKKVTKSGQKTGKKRYKRMQYRKRKAVIESSDDESSGEDVSMSTLQEESCFLADESSGNHEGTTSHGGPDVEVEKDFVANETNNTMSDEDDLDVEQFGPQVAGVKPDGKTFRLPGAKYLITFPKQSTSQVQELDVTADPDGKSRGHLRRLRTFYEKLAEKSGRRLVKYSIGWEKHNPKKRNYDSKRPFHLHLYLEFDKALNPTSSTVHCRYFDCPFLSESGSETHCNIRTIKKHKNDYVRVVHYTQGTGSKKKPQEGEYFLTNITDLPPLDSLEKPTRAHLSEQALAVLVDDSLPKQERYKQACDLTKQANPEKWIYDGQRAKAHFQSILGSTDKGFYTMDDYIIQPVDPEIYLGNRAKGMRPKCVVVIGDPESGKTQWALAHFKHPIRINGTQRACLEALSKINEYTDGIVIDDTTFLVDHEGKPRDADFTKALLDIEMESRIDARYKANTIPAGIPRFICHNEWPFRTDFKPVDQAAVESRLHRVRIPKGTKTFSLEISNRRRVIRQLVSFACANVAKRIAAEAAEVPEAFF